MNFQASNHKRLFVVSMILLSAVAIGVLTYQIAFASPSFLFQQPTNTNLEHNQERFDHQKTELAKISDPTLKANAETKLKFYEKQGTEQAVAVTKIPTLASIRKSQVAKMTANPRQATAFPLQLRKSGLKPGYSNIYLAKDVKMTGAWFDINTDGSAIIYIAGGLRETKQGVVLRYNEVTKELDRYLQRQETLRLSTSKIHF